MKVKIDTKEKFHVLTVLDVDLSANMTEEINQELLLYFKKNIKNVVLNMHLVEQMDEVAANTLVNIQQKFYDNNVSFVICGIKPAVEKYLDNLELLEIMNVTLTESEAWDIVQLEEIERELLE